MLNRRKHLFFLKSCIRLLAEAYFVSSDIGQQPSGAAAETNGQLKPMLPSKGTSLPYGFDVRGDHRLHINGVLAVMKAEVFPACFTGFRKVGFILVFRITLYNIHVVRYFRTEVIQDRPCPYFLHIDAVRNILEVSLSSG